MLKLHVVGAGTPTPTPLRFGTCYVVEVGGEMLMFDCGPASTYKMVSMGLWPTQVEHLFFSHHHFDHNVDYPCFVLCRWDQGAGRIPPLKVWGPSPTLQVTERLFAQGGAFHPDWEARVEHPGSQEIYEKRGGRLPRKPPSLEVEEIDAHSTVEGTDWKVTCARVRHIEPLMPTLAYRLEAGGSSLVISSDTGVCQSIVELAQGAETLLIHCWDSQKRMGGDEGGMITGTVEAAQIAAQAKVERVILSHLGPRLDQPEEREQAIAEVAAVFKGKIIFASERQTLEL